MNNTVESPLPHTQQRHALLQQIHILAGTGQGWVRIRNPRKTNLGSGLPDHLYRTRDPGNRPNSALQRAVGELDRHGLLGPEPSAAGPDDVDTSALGARVLAAWNAEFGEPGNPG